MLYLYEIELRGCPSESYRRVYVMASGDEQALDLSFAAFQKDEKLAGEEISRDDLVIDEQVEVKENFCSKPSDFGLEI